MRSLALAALALSSVSCLGSFDKFLPEDDRFSAGARFAYTAEGRIGDPLVEGVISVIQSDSITFTGTWEAHRVPGSNTTRFVGGQVGTGTVSGGLSSNGALRLVLTDGDSTTQVIASGVPDTLGYHGRWSVNSPSGFRAGGPFVASLLP